MKFVIVWYWSHACSNVPKHILSLKKVVRKYSSTSSHFLYYSFTVSHPLFHIFMSFLIFVTSQQKKWHKTENKTITEEFVATRKSHATIWFAKSKPVIYIKPNYQPFVSRGSSTRITSHIVSSKVKYSPITSPYRKSQLPGTWTKSFMNNSKLI